MGRTTAVVTGASSGLGKAIAERLAADGARVIGTSRGAPADGPIADTGLTMAALDVCCDASVQAFADRLAGAGIVPDTLVLNAGFGISGAIEETPAAAALAQIDTNLVGAHRVVRALLPFMRAAGGGRLVFIGSVAGRIALPFQGFYCASKAALASYADALRIELRPFGIRVTLIEPGDHRTDFPARRQAHQPAAGSLYDPLKTRVLGAMVASEQAGAPAERLAALVARICHSATPARSHFRMSAFERMFVVLKAVLPGAWFEAVLRRAYGIG
jgi:NAD(P)-dependent dehydrogenase (short-subunit alcohol dehydrogenase family)